MNVHLSHREEPAFVDAAARLDALSNPRQSGLSAHVALLLQMAHSELTDLGAQVPAQLVDVDLAGDSIEAIVKTLGELTALRAGVTDLADVLRITRAIDHTREAENVARFELGLVEDGSTR